MSVNLPGRSAMGGPRLHTRSSGATPGLCDAYVSEPGWMVPRALIHALPGWMKVRWGSQLVWQWFGMIVTRVVAAAAMLLTYQTGSVVPQSDIKWQTPPPSPVSR